MKKRNLKFALLLEDGKPVRSMEELKMYYDIDKVLAYFQNGQLERWLEQNEYIEQLKMIQELKSSLNNELINGVNSILIECKNPLRSSQEPSMLKYAEKSTSGVTNLKHSFNTSLEIGSLEIDSEIKAINPLQNLTENKEEEFSNGHEQVYSSMFEQADTNGEMSSQLSKEEVKSLFDDTIQDAISQQKNIQELQKSSISEEAKTSIFKKPAFIDKDEEIYGLGKRGLDESFKLKNKNKKLNFTTDKIKVDIPETTDKIEVDIAETTDKIKVDIAETTDKIKVDIAETMDKIQVGIPEIIEEIIEKPVENKKVKMSDNDFFDDDFFEEEPEEAGESEKYNEGNVNNENSNKIDIDMINNGMLNKSKANIDKVEPFGSGEKRFQISQGIMNTAVADSPKEILASSGLQLDNVGKTPIRKFSFGLEKLNTQVDIGKSNTIKPENNLAMENSDLGMLPPISKNYSGSEIEDNRKQLLELKKNSVFSKLKAENDNQIKTPINDNGRPKINIEPIHVNDNNANNIKEKNDMTSFVADPSSVGMIKDFYIKNQKNDVNTVKKTTLGISFDDINSSSGIEEDNDLNSKIDIDNIIKKINKNVENNAKLYGDYEVEGSKHEDISANTGTLTMDSIGGGDQFSFEEEDLSKKIESINDEIIDDRLDNAKQASRINYLDPTVKSYKGTVYSQKDYEELLQRRRNDKTRLKVVVSCNNLKIKDTDVNIEYFGINKPTILLIGKNKFDSIASNISFVNLRISSLNNIAFVYDKLDNVTIDKTKVKKGIRELLDKYPEMALSRTKCPFLMKYEDTTNEGNSVEEYMDRLFTKTTNDSKLMATVDFDGLHIYTNIAMGVINMAFYRTNSGEVHDISDFFVGSDTIDIFSKDMAIGIEYVALITQDVAEEIKKTSQKEYANSEAILADVFSNEDMYQYLEHVILSPIKILKQDEVIDRIDQVKMIDIMNLDTNIPYIYKIFEGNKQDIKDSLVDFVEMMSNNRTQNGINFNGINVELLSEELEQNEQNSIIYYFNN